MYIVQSYSFAVLLCIITMLCWGSWGNTQKLAARSWRYELFYWDYVIGIVLTGIILGFSLGSFGSEGRSFIADLQQADWKNMSSAVLGGIIFNAANILLAASVSLAGLSVAFPLGVGLALSLGVIINYIGQQKGDPMWLFIGVFLVVTAIILNGIAAKKTQKENKSNNKGIILAIVAGVLMSFFYRFVAESMDLENFAQPQIGKLTPYTAFFIFSLGILLSNFVFNTIVMKKPFAGNSVTYKEYFKGKFSTHLVGLLGGLIWALGTCLSYIASGQAGMAISYGLGQGATMVAAVWGVFVWREFKGGGKTVNLLLALMFILFISGLGLIIYAGN